MTLASARDAIRIMSWLKTNAPHAQVLVAANKVQTGGAEISRADFEASIERKINFSIPFDLKAASNAAKLGQTFADANRSSKSASVMRDIAQTILGAADEDGVDIVDRAKGKSLIDKFDFKSLLARKDKAPAREAAE
jgi:pilus assembly protein CpaE